MYEKFSSTARIVCAAIKFEQLIIAGPRHFDKVMQSAMPKDFKISDWAQGFVDQYGNFYNRMEALRQCNNTGQRVNLFRNGSETELFSEGLY